MSNGMKATDRLMLEASSVGGYLAGVAQGPMSDEGAAEFFERVAPDLKRYSDSLLALVQDCLEEREPK